MWLRWILDTVCSDQVPWLGLRWAADSQIEMTILAGLIVAGPSRNFGHSWNCDQSKWLEATTFDIPKSMPWYSGARYTLRTEETFVIWRLRSLVADV